MRLRIGVDVGGTNTDAVVLESDEVRGSAKVPTTPDVTSGIESVLNKAIADASIDVGAVDAVMIGTTHFTNAVIEGRNLNPTAVIRLGAPATTAVPPLTGWPTRLTDRIGHLTFVLHGGYEFDARTITPVDEEELRAAARLIDNAGVTAAAVTAVFSPLKDDQETWAARLLDELVPGIRVSLSSQLGRLGLLERENATVINASLADLAEVIVDSLESAVGAAGIDSEVWMTQNDGTLMSREVARLFPASTFASGPTNSIRGAALLAGKTDCIVIDVGGTTTDVGTLDHGFPREAPGVVEFGGVRTNFRMPDVHSIGLGGGSIVKTDPELSIGPESVGYRLDPQAMVFGGETVTATDIAVAAGLAEIGDPSLVEHLDPGLVSDCLELIRDDVADAVDHVKTSRGSVEAILVGGGSVIVDGSITGISRLSRPAHYEVANAVGASIAQVSGEVDRVVSLDSFTREAAVSSAREEARRRCISAGADPNSVRIVDIDQIPLSYLPSNAIRLRVRAIGDLMGWK